VKDDRIFLGHVRDAINDIKAYASVGEEAFLADRMRQDAMIRKLEIVGEAVKRLSEEIRAQRPEIPWKQIAGMRDRLTHAWALIHERLAGDLCLRRTCRKLSQPSRLGTDCPSCSPLRVFARCPGKLTAGRLFALTPA
jgi:uncharacterized protein with HEPN domain